MGLKDKDIKQKIEKLRKLNNLIRGLTINELKNNEFMAEFVKLEILFNDMDKIIKLPRGTVSKLRFQIRKSLEGIELK